MAALATTDQYGIYTGVPVAADDIERIQFLLDAVSDDIRTYCGWSISAEEGAEWTLDGDGSTVLGVPTLLLRAVDSVTIDGETVDVADVEWSRDGYLIRQCRWPRKLRSVVVVGDHGYDPNPPVIVTVACSLVSRLSATAGAGNATSVRIGDYSETRPNTNQLIGAVGPDMLGASPSELNILDRYRIALRS